MSSTITPEVQGLVLILARKLGWEGPIIAIVGETGTEEAVRSALRFIVEHAYIEWEPYSKWKGRHTHSPSARLPL